MGDLEYRTECCTLSLDSVSGDLRRITWHDPALEVISEPRLGENFRILLPRPRQERLLLQPRPGGFEYQS